MEQKQYDVLCGFMDHLTKDYLWYYDTPEKRFEWSPGSIWLINPKTKKWVIELKKGGELWWYSNLYVNFKRYFNMEGDEYEKFIKAWMEDVLNRGVSLTDFWTGPLSNHVEDVLNRGVSSIRYRFGQPHHRTEDVLNHGKTIQ